MITSYVPFSPTIPKHEHFSCHAMVFQYDHILRLPTAFQHFGKTKAIYHIIDIICFDLS